MGSLSLGEPRLLLTQVCAIAPEFGGVIKKAQEIKEKPQDKLGTPSHRTECQSSCTILSNNSVHINSSIWPSIINWHRNVNVMLHAGNLASSINYLEN